MSDILTTLNEQQRQAASHLDGPALVIAGPGSGKTRVLTYRIARLIQEQGIKPHNILAITFTNKAAGEMKERVAKLLGTEAPSRPSMGTFHSTCARWLRRSGQAINIPPNFTIYDDSDSKQAIKQIMDQLKIAKDEINPNTAKWHISSAKNSLISAAEYPKYAYGFRQELAAKIYSEYQKLLAASNALDFDDLLFKAVQLFVERPDVLDEYQNRFKYILVDEYQDTNQAQYLLSKLLANRHKNVFVVGDMAQAIYSWRGADYRNLTNFQKDYPDTKIYHLEKNYRSTPNIINAAKEVIKHNRHHVHLDLWTDNAEGEKVTLYTASDERDEARYIIDKLEGSNASWNAAILYRTNAQSRTLEEALMKAGIPYRLVGGIKFYQRKEIKDILAFLALLLNPRDTVARERVLDIGKRRTAKFDMLVASDQIKPEHHPIEIIDRVTKGVDYFGYLDKGTPESAARIENVKELRSVAANFDTLLDFLENVSLVQDNNFPLFAKEEQTEAVVLSTLHSAKGLEFDHVFMVGMEETLLPHSRSIGDQSQLEEERRLCYVGMTRAKKDLHLIHTVKRLYFGSTHYNEVSRFVNEISDELLNRCSSPLLKPASANLKTLRWDDDPLDSFLMRDNWDL